MVHLIICAYRELNILVLGLGIVDHAHIVMEVSLHEGTLVLSGHSGQLLPNGTLGQKTVDFTHCKTTTKQCAGYPINEDHIVSVT